MTRQTGSGEIPLAVLLVGDQATLRDEARARLRGQVVGAAPNGFDEDRFDLAESRTDAARIVCALRTLPMLAPRRWVEVRGLADRRAKAFLEELLPAYLGAPSATTCLVLEAERVDRRQRWVKRIGEVGQVIECSAPSRPADLRRWIEERLRARGKRSAAGASELLAEAVGADLDTLANEIEKLCLYVGERAEVKGDDVSALTGTVRARAIYELTDLVGQRRADAALSMLARLLHQGEAPLALLGALASQFRRLIRARECVPLQAGELQKRLGLHPFVAQRLLEQAQRYSDARLATCLDLTRRTDEVLKGALPLDPEIALEQLILASCS